MGASANELLLLAAKWMREYSVASSGVTRCNGVGWGRVGRSHLQTGRAGITVSRRQCLLQGRALTSRGEIFSFSKTARGGLRYMYVEGE